MANQKQEELIRAFKDILKAESYGSQGEIVEGLKTQIKFIKVFVELDIKFYGNHPNTCFRIC